MSLLRLNCDRTVKNDNAGQIEPLYIELQMETAPSTRQLLNSFLIVAAR